MLQVRKQEPDLDYKVQEVPWQSDEAKEQDTWSQEVEAECRKGILQNQQLLLAIL
jgi:hypothetical protein